MGEEGGAAGGSGIPVLKPRGLARGTAAFHCHQGESCGQDPGRGTATGLGRGGGPSTFVVRLRRFSRAGGYLGARSGRRGRPGRSAAGAEGSAAGLDLANPRQRPRPRGVAGPPLQSPLKSQLRSRRGFEVVGKLCFASAASAGG